MPQLTHHDFYSNFTASIKAGDLDMTNDIFANELSDFIVFDTDKIVEALNKSDITSITNKDTDEAIVDSVIKNIASNSKLTKALAYIIAEGNELLTNTNDKQKQLQIIGSISDGLNKIATDISKNPDTFKSSTMAQVVSKAAKRTEYNRVIWNKDKKTGLSIGWYFVIGGGILALTIGFIYYRQKRAVSKAIPNMIMGPDLHPGVTAQAVPPITPEIAPIPLLPEPVTSPIHNQVA